MLLAYYLFYEVPTLTAFLRMSKEIMSALVEKCSPRILLKGFNLPLIICSESQFPQNHSEIVYTSKQISFMIRNKSKLTLSFNW